MSLTNLDISCLNQAIKIEDVDEGQTVQRIEDIELGIGRRPQHKFGLSSADSTDQLLGSAEEKLPSLKESIRSSLNERWRWWKALKA